MGGLYVGEEMGKAAHVDHHIEFLWGRCETRVEAWLALGIHGMCPPIEIATAYTIGAMIFREAERAIALPTDAFLHSVFPIAVGVFWAIAVLLFTPLCAYFHAVGLRNAWRSLREHWRD